MKAQDIERVEFAELHIDSARAELANKAASLFKYKKLKEYAGISLLGVLRELDIQPLVTSQVDAYKSSKEYIGKWSGTYWSFGWVVLCLLAMWNTSHYFDKNTANFPTVASGLVSMLALIFGLVAVGSDSFRGHRTVRSWKTFSLNGYDSYPGAIPEHVLLKAVQIKEKAPSVDFYVDQLMEQRENHPVRDPDPFLVAVLDGERYYIDVWDEKEYERVL